MATAVNLSLGRCREYLSGISGFFLDLTRERTGQDRGRYVTHMLVIFAPRRGYLSVG